MIFRTKETFEELFIITESIYQGFIDLFNDRNPLHTNKHYARNKGFVDRVMHGNILNGFISYFIGECLPQKNVIIHTQEITYKSAIYANDKLFFFAEVIDIHESVGVVQFKFKFRNSEKKIVAIGKIQIGILK